MLQKFKDTYLALISKSFISWFSLKSLGYIPVVFFLSLPWFTEVITVTDTEQLENGILFSLRVFRHCL